jgi:hypothetical protein
MVISEGNSYNYKLAFRVKLGPNLNSNTLLEPILDLLGHLQMSIYANFILQMSCSGHQHIEQWYDTNNVYKCGTKSHSMS